MEIFLKHISVDPEIRFGKPCIKGTRITVSDVLQCFASGMSEAEILSDYPFLTKEQLREALTYKTKKSIFN